MELINNDGLSIKQLFRKCDLIQELINLGYDLSPELSKVVDAINLKLRMENEECLRQNK